MWTRSSSDALNVPGKSSSELTQRLGYRVLLQAREIAWVGFLGRFGPVLPEALVRTPIRSTAEIAEAAIRTMERTAKKISFLLLFRVMLGGVCDVAPSRSFNFGDEPPRSDGSSLP